MKSLLNIFYVVVGVSIFSCTKKVDCCAVIDTNVAIQYVNESGEDLFNVHSDYSTKDVKIYYKNGDSYEYMYDTSLDDPYHFSIDSSMGENMFSIYTSYYYEGNISVTLIELNESTIDTIRGEYTIDGNNRILNKVWYNGVIQPGRNFTIVKK